MVVFKQTGLDARKTGLVLILIGGAALIFFGAISLIGRPPARPAENDENGPAQVAAPVPESGNLDEGTPADNWAPIEEEPATTTVAEIATTTPAEEETPPAAEPEPEPAAEPPAKTAPASVAPKTIPAATTVPVKPAAPVDPELASSRDEKRGVDMRRLSAAQRLWYTDHKKYYPTHGIPAAIGSATLRLSDPINAGSVCGRDYVYCGIDNAYDTSKFCYFAKLEAGGYYIVSEIGNLINTAPPASLADCTALAIAAAKPKTVEEVLPATAKERDAVRKAAMIQLVTAQNLWFYVKGKYFTCGPNGGDCPGNSHSYPATMGFAMTQTPADPINSGLACGRDYIYCGLDNTANSAKFCYFAKLEGGGYYTATNAGNFERTAAPATLAECAQMN